MRPSQGQNWFFNFGRSKRHYRERDADKGGRVSFAATRKIVKINFTNCKCLSKVLQYVRKYLQNSFVHLNSIEYMFLGHYNVFNTLTFQRQTVKSNIFGTYITHLEVSLCASFKKNFLLHLQFDQAFANLFTPKLNAICFVTVNSNFYTLPFNNLFQYYLITVFITRAPLFSPFNS